MEHAPVALVTGTSSGIGLSTAITLAKAGYRVVATMRDLNKREALEQRARLESVALEVSQLDVVDATSCAECVARVVGVYGSIDLLVNNAGAIRMGSLEQLTDEDLHAVFEQNFFGMARLTRLVLAQQRSQRVGRIVVVSSIGGVLGHPFVDGYCAAKAATESLVESLAPVAAVFGISISLVEPGPVATADVGRMEAAVSAMRDTIDENYHRVFNSFADNFTSRYNKAQSPDDVDAVILEVATAKQPLLLYQTSHSVRRFVEQKVVDLDGRVAMSLGSEALVPSMEPREA